MKCSNDYELEIEILDLAFILLFCLCKLTSVSVKCIWDCLRSQSHRDFDVVVVVVVIVLDYSCVYFF